MSLTKIFERYITQYIIEADKKDAAKSGKKVKEFNNIRVVQKIIAQVEEDVLMLLKGTSPKRHNANESLVCFFEANTQRMPAGKLENIQGKNQPQPKYICLDSITEKIESVYGREEEAYIPSSSKKKLDVLRPSSSLPVQVFSLIEKLIGRNED
jgi:hypothetical protein